MDKPYISGSFDRGTWAGWQYDTPLFSMWTVGWSEPSGCGHDSCGDEWLDESFATWNEALNFALRLVTE